MFLDWPSQKQELQEELQRAIRRRFVAGAAVVAQVPHVVLREGDMMAVMHPDGSRTEMKLSAHEVSWEVERSEILRGGGEHLLHAIEKLGGGLAREMETNLIETIRDASEKAGTVFQGKSNEEMANEFLKALESMEVDFDEEGHPSVVMIASPQMVQRLAELETPEMTQAVNEILDRKRNDWLRREARRRLAD